VAALRSAAGHTELPFADRILHRKFPLPTDRKYSFKGEYLYQQAKTKRPQTTPVFSKTLEKDSESTIDTDYESLVDECAANLLNGNYPKIQNPPETLEDLIRVKIRRLCPELYYMDKTNLIKCEKPGSNISVRHVQPMAPGKHFVCRNIAIAEPEQCLRRSPTMFRKVMFEQTARIFQSEKRGAIVYDVFDSSVSDQLKTDLK
jgi:hypothetical protein